MSVDSDQGMTLAEYAAHCREVCDRTAQGGGMCGREREAHGETVVGFCGRHWGPVLDLSGGAA